jgi:hypothetical protein
MPVMRNGTGRRVNMHDREYIRNLLGLWCHLFAGHAELEKRVAEQQRSFVRVPAVAGPVTGSVTWCPTHHGETHILQNMQFYTIGRICLWRWGTGKTC